MTLRETALHSHCLGLLGDRAHPVNMIIYMEHGHEKAIHW